MAWVRQLPPLLAQTKMEQCTVPAPVADTAAGVTGSSPGAPLQQPDLPAVLRVIQASREAVENKVDGLRIDLSLIQWDLRKVTDMVTRLRRAFFTAEDDLTTLKSQVSKLMSSVTTLHERAEDAENQE
ncbi:hypothetical protein NDU88_004287 [Pleurodeles waltl]|uniref:Uncharacterized protein n=1 Tax=Pleurodeles waltl TaxID=8319 RepID=A0AAV7NS28_PLEWA|nr:hypothetical protein NDU88_004287 [Pleurodeles waltl]